MTELTCSCGAAIQPLTGEDALDAVMRHISTAHGASLADGRVESTDEGRRDEAAQSKKEVLRCRESARTDGG